VRRTRAARKQAEQFRAQERRAKQREDKASPLDGWHEVAAALRVPPAAPERTAAQTQRAQTVCERDRRHEHSRRSKPLPAGRRSIFIARELCDEVGSENAVAADVRA